MLALPRIDDRSTPTGPTVSLSTTAAALAVALVLRLHDIAAAPFVHDEALFLGAARRQLMTGEWLSVSPIDGTQGVRYGPSVVWLYSAIQWVVGDSALAAIVVVCAALTIVQVLVARALTALAGGGTATFALILGLLLSSPYLWFWSRLAWDPTLLITSGVVVAILCRRDEVDRRAALAIGALLGLALSSHLMVVPFVVAVVTVIGGEVRRAGRRVAPALVPIVVVAVVVSAPYLWHLATHDATPSSLQPRAVLALAHLAETPAISTAFGIEYFFDHQWAALRTSLGPHAWLLGLRSVALAAVMGTSIWGLLIGWRAASNPVRRISRVAVLTWGLSVALFSMQGLQVHPHYQWATWWVAPLGLAVAGVHLAHTPRVVRWLAGGAAVVLIGAQLAFVLMWGDFARDGSGTRDLRQGPSVTERAAAVRAMCSGSAGQLVVRNETNTHSEPYLYLAATSDPCASTRLRFCDATTCRDDARNSPDMILRYRDEHGASLVVEHVER